LVAVNTATAAPDENQLEVAIIAAINRHEDSRSFDWLFKLGHSCPL
jgi:hypothetical protein